MADTENNPPPHWTPGAWFGEPWPRPDYRAPVCEDDALRVAAPVGLRCAWCQERIAATDQGTFLLTFEGPDPVHRECSFRQVMGGIGHHEDHALWCGERKDPDGGRTARQSALEVCALHVLEPDQEAAQKRAERYIQADPDRYFS